MGPSILRVHTGTEVTPSRRPFAAAPQSPLSSTRPCFPSPFFSRHSTLLVRSQPLRVLPLRPRVRTHAASPSQPAGDSTRKSRWDPLLADSDLSCPVPDEQQPVNEYNDLSEAIFFSWVTMGPVNLALRLAAIGIFFAAVFGWPVSSVTFDPKKEALQCVLGALGGGLAATTIATLRLYLGWSYVGNRLFSATVEYEETGWYDGQVWVKSPELLARDRLLASYRVKPVLNKLKGTLLGLGASLAITTALLIYLPPYTPQPDPMPPRPYSAESFTSNGVRFSVIRAGQKRYDPAAVEQYEVPDSVADEILLPSSDNVKAGSAGAALQPSLGPECGGASATASSATGWALSAHQAQGFGFELLEYSEADVGIFPASSEVAQSEAVADLLEFDEADADVILVSAGDEGEDDIFDISEAGSVADSLNGVADVVIIATVQQTVGDTEATRRPLEGASDARSVLGRGVRLDGVRVGSKNVLISDHLGIGANGELTMKLLKE